MREPEHAYDAALVRRVAAALRRIGRIYFRARVEGLHHLPEGGFLGVGTHNGSVMMPDTFLWFASYHEAHPTTPMYVLAHDLLAKGGRLARAVAKLGALRAEPGAAARLLARGARVMVYPGGDFDAEKPFHKRHTVEFAGRTGYARQAIRAGVPICPVVSVGAHEGLFILTDGQRLARALGLPKRFRLQVFPFMFCLPWVVFWGVPPFYLPLPTQITIRALPPIDTKVRHGESEAEAILRIDAEVRSAMQAALTAMSRGRIPVVG
jgi:1-acyl-sn-glycerol-3-phosphate acyltransferase